MAVKCCKLFLKGVHIWNNFWPDVGPPRLKKRNSGGLSAPVLPIRGKGTWSTRVWDFHEDSNFRGADTPIDSKVGIHAQVRAEAEAKTGVGVW